MNKKRKKLFVPQNNGQIFAHPFSYETNSLVQFEKNKIVYMEGGTVQVKSIGGHAGVYIIIKK